MDLPASFDGALGAEVLNPQKYPRDTLLQCVDGSLIAPTTEECGQMTEGIFR